MLACATCRVDPTSATNSAANGAVFLMLAFLALMFGGLATLAFSFARRARAHAAAQIGAQTNVIH